MKNLRPFIEEPGCIKCLNNNMELKLYGIDEEEYIEVTCSECGYTWNMATADSGKKQVILEEEKAPPKEYEETEEGMKAKEDDDTKLAPVEKVLVDGPIDEKLLQRCIDTMNVGRDKKYFWSLADVTSAEKRGDAIWLTFGKALYGFNDKGGFLPDEVL